MLENGTEENVAARVEETSHRNMDGKAFLEQQYLTLRKEIESSRNRHFKIAAGAVVIVPAVEIFASAIKASIFEQGSTDHMLAIPLLVLLLLLPIIVLALHAIWVAEHLAISRCGYYIRENIEPALQQDVVGWEKWLGRTWVEQRAEALQEKGRSDRSGISLRLNLKDLKRVIRQGASLHPKVGSDLKEVRAHEGLQELAFRLLYVSLYMIAAVSTVFVCLAALGKVINVVWVQLLVQVLVGSGLLSIYTYLWLVERDRVQFAVIKEADALEEKREAHFRGSL